MRRINVLAIGMLLTLGALAGTALAKEGAVTKLDALPPGGFHAGQMIPVGFQILMDGVDVSKADPSWIRPSRKSLFMSPWVTSSCWRVPSGSFLPSWPVIRRQLGARAPHWHVMAAEMFGTLRRSRVRGGPRRRRRNAQ